jgi:hypothetical protein
MAGTPPCDPALKARRHRPSSAAPTHHEQELTRGDRSVDQAAEKTYFGLTLSQHAERIRKLASERGLSGDAFDRVTMQAVAMIPTIRLNEGTHR